MWAWSTTKRLRFVAWKVVEKGKEVATNRNGLGVEVKLKKFKV